MYYPKFSKARNCWCVMADYGGMFAKLVEYGFSSESEAKIMIGLLIEQDKLNDSK